MSAEHERRVAEALAALRRLPVPQLPDHELDQLRAATTSARGFLDRFGLVAGTLEPDRWGSTHPRHSDEEEAAREAWVRVLLALTGSRFCPHLRRGGPQPATARLPLHRVDCDRCLQTSRRPPRDEADRCDWCGDRGIETFHPVALHVGPLVAIGDACHQCGTALRAAAGEVLR